MMTTTVNRALPNNQPQPTISCETAQPNATVAATPKIESASATLVLARNVTSVIIGGDPVAICYRAGELPPDAGQSAAFSAADIIIERTVAPRGDTSNRVKRVVAGLLCCVLLSGASGAVAQGKDEFTLGTVRTIESK